MSCVIGVSRVHAAQVESMGSRQGEISPVAFDSKVGMALPDGWAAISNGILHDTISQPFPSNGVAFGTYNVGEGSDRTLATGNTDSS